MFENLEVAINKIVALDTDTMSEGELAEAIVEIRRLHCALDAGVASILAACERSNNAHVA